MLKPCVLLLTRVLIVSVILAARISAQASTVIVGSVKSDGAPVAGAMIEILGLTATRSDSLGRFRLTNAPVGDVAVRVMKVGFSPELQIVKTVANKEKVIDVALTSVPQTMDPVSVTAREPLNERTDPYGFERRRQKELNGIFITADQIARRHTRELEPLFFGLPGVQMDTGGIVVIKHGEISLRDIYLTGKSVNQFNMCIGAQVLIDRVEMPQPFNINEVQVGRVRGIEIYRSAATTPAELRTKKTVCGTVAIWTW